MVLVYVKNMSNILLHVSLFSKAGWDSVFVVSGKVSSESVDSGHCDIIGVSYGFCGLNERVGLEDLRKAAWRNRLSV